MPRLDPAVARTRLAVRAVLAETAPGDLILVACSGGSDSLALAAATAFEAPRAGLRAGAVVVDHGLQAGSREQAERVAAQCRALGLDPVSVSTVHPGGGGVEAAARTARYAALEQRADDGDARLLLLGHTQDDQAETVLLRLARGSGARSLAGIPPARGRFRRPFLDLRRHELREACAAQALTWWEDPGNAVDGPLRRADGAALPRSAVRHRVLPELAAALGSDPVPALARSADQLRADADLLESLAAAELALALVPPDAGREPQALEPGALEPHPANPPALDAVALAALHPALLPRVLRAWLLAQGAPGGDLGAGHLDAVADLVTGWRGQRGVDVPGFRVVRVGGRLRLV